MAKIANNQLIILFIAKRIHIVRNYHQTIQKIFKNKNIIKKKLKMKNNLFFKLLTMILEIIQKQNLKVL